MNEVISPKATYCGKDDNNILLLASMGFNFYRKHPFKERHIDDILLYNKDLARKAIEIMKQRPKMIQVLLDYYLLPDLRKIVEGYLDSSSKELNKQLSELSENFSVHDQVDERQNITSQLFSFI